MSNLERNWLIRTSQNQILGPVAKAKVIEFIQKGALGGTDEISSGNGYWFHLREKEFLDKYIYGDVPQSYNPISEAKTVLARKLNPEKTTSINASPANITQVINIKNLNLSTNVPKNEDLEFPDNTIVQKVGDPNEITKLPSNDDLEFPDITQIQSNLGQLAESKSIDSGKPIQKAISIPNPTLPNEDIKLPDSNDLDYPDMDSISNITFEEDIKFEVNLTIPEHKSSPNLNSNSKQVTIY